MTRLTLTAPAKVNLHLEILGRDPSGYHRLETVFHTLTVADTVTVEHRAGAGTTCTVDGADLPTGTDNLAVAAVEAVRQTGVDPGAIAIHLTKHLPAGGGLGGGSSDAAAVLRALGRLLGPRLPAPTRLAVARRLGADVAFFLHGGCAWATGRGDELTPLDDRPSLPLTVHLPPFACSTPAVYAALRDDERGPRRAHGANAFVDLLTGTDRPRLHNRLHAAAARHQPALLPLYRTLTARGQPWLLCGSGSSLLNLDHTDPLPGCRAIHTTLRPRAALDRTDAAG